MCNGKQDEAAGRSWAVRERASAMYQESGRRWPLCIVLGIMLNDPLPGPQTRQAFNFIIPLACIGPFKKAWPNLPIFCATTELVLAKDAYAEAPLCGLTTLLLAFHGLVQHLDLLMYVYGAKAAKFLLNGPGAARTWQRGRGCVSSVVYSAVAPALLGAAFATTPNYDALAFSSWMAINSARVARSRVYSSARGYARRSATPYTCTAWAATTAGGISGRQCGVLVWCTRNGVDRRGWCTWCLSAYCCS